MLSVSVVKLTTFLAPYEHVLITCCLSFQVFRGSVFYFWSLHVSTWWYTFKFKLKILEQFLHESACECWGFKKTTVCARFRRHVLWILVYFTKTMKEYMLCWMTFAWQTFASLRLFTCLVYVSTYCVPIALLRQNKPFPLLYLGHAQIISMREDTKLVCRKTLAIHLTRYEGRQ